MRLRVSPGPVFAMDMVRLARRWQTFAARALMVGGVLVVFVITYLMRPDLASRNFRENAIVGQLYFQVMAIVQMSLVLFLAPAMSAGTIVSERTRGTLFHAFLTDLNDWEIVFGKFASRVIPLFLLLAATLPVVSLLMLLGGVQPVQVVELYLLLSAYCLCIPAFGILAAVWAKRVTDVLALTYSLVIFWSLWPMISFVLDRPGPRGRLPFEEYAPFELLITSLQGGRTGQLQLCFEVFAAGVLASAALLTISALFLRRTSLNFGEQSAGARKGKQRRRWGAAPNLDKRPVLWLEWARNRRGIAYYLLHFVLVSLGGFALVLFAFARDKHSAIGPVFLMAAALAVGQLFLLVLAAGNLAEDRENRNMELLGQTPLAARGVLRDKADAAVRASRTMMWLPYAFLAIALVRDPLLGPLGAPILLAAAYGFSRLTTAFAFWSALRMRKTVLALGAGVLFLIVLNVVLPTFTFSLAHAGRPFVGLLQTSPFFAYVCGGAVAVDWDFLNREFSALNALWTFVLTSLCWFAASLLDRSSVYRLEALMRNESSAAYDRDPVDWFTDLWYRT
jgi:ABC-type transport system involved in multi-copper enzyme maturation permease subunit